jgi:hypothetical protein
MPVKKTHDFYSVVPSLLADVRNVGGPPRVPRTCTNRANVLRSSLLSRLSIRQTF